MRFRTPGALRAALTLLLVSCSDGALVEPSLDGRSPLLALGDDSPTAWISEFHYDNAGTDAGEFVEVMGTAGTNLVGWQVVLYNGSNGAPYHTTTLAGIIPGSCGERGVVVVEYPANGIQNGSPDAIALVDSSGVVVEFFSYEGPLTATSGPAAGQTAADVGVSEAGAEAAGWSLQRGDTGAWGPPAPETRGACNGGPPGGAAPPPPPPAAGPVFLSELHYDNASTDTGEGFEVQGPAGFDLTGWSVVLYNGNGGAPYATVPLDGAIPAVCGEVGVVHRAHASIQNGPDGLALVAPGDSVVEFLSYGGSFAAVGGPADGTASTDVGVTETGSTPAGHSLQRRGGVWQAPAPATFGACNEGGDPPPAGATTLVIHELMGDPVSAESASWGEWFEVYNHGAEPVNLQGWTIASGGSGQPDHVVAAAVTVPAGGYAVLGRGADVARNGGVALDYNYFVGGSSTIWLDGSDWLALRDPSGATADSVRWTALPRGATRALRDPAAENADVDGPGWGYSTVTFGDGDYGTPGAANGTLADTPPTPPVGGARLSFSGRTAGDPALPVGFQDQLFASGGTAPYTWSSDTPALATVDQDGVVTATGAGTAVIRAVDADGAFGTVSLATRVAVAGTTADYRGNAEFGEPADGDASDDFVVRRAQYTASYSSTRGTPNWVAYDLDASHFGAEDRCDCFTHDPELPAGYPVISTADYTGAGTHAGFGIDRGHLVRSFDRTTGSLDNAVTYYFSNIVPQAADNNQGPWSALEMHLGDLARVDGREVYVLAGVAGSQGTVKGEGKIVVPGSVWKVAVVLPRDHGLGQVDAASDLEVVAVVMPNVAGIRDTPWEQFRTTVDVVEAVSGYDLLALLPDHVEAAVEGARSEAATPVGSDVAVRPTDAVELTFASVTRAGTTSVTPSATAPATPLPAHVTAGASPVFHYVETTALFAGPVRACFAYGDSHGFPDERLIHLYHARPGGGWEDVTAAGFPDPAADVVCGDVDALGTFVLVAQTPRQAVAALLAAVDGLVAGGALHHGNGNALGAKLRAAAAQLEKGHSTPAANQLRAFVHQVEALVGADRLPDARGEALAAAARRAINLLD